MSLSILDWTIQKHPQVCATFAGDELVVMGNRDKIYYRVNPSGIRIWNFMQSKVCSVDEVVEYIADHYGLEKSHVLSDVVSFIVWMTDKDIFQFVDE